MKKKHIRRLFTLALAYLFLGTSVSAPTLYAAASGNYTDLLPIGAAANTTVWSNGSGWSLTTLPPTQTSGDALSRVIDTVYQSTAIATITGVTTVSTFTALGQGSVGSTTFPASWVATGRTIEVTVNGLLSTGASETGTWKLLIGTTTILNSGAATLTASQTKDTITAKATITVGTTGGAGTAFGTYAIYLSSGSNTSGATTISFSTGTNVAVPVDWTSQLAVNPTFTFGSGLSTYTVTNVAVKFLN